MGSAKRTLAIVALTTTLVSCSAPTLPASTPTVQADALRVYTTTATRPLFADLTAAYSARQSFPGFDTRQANYRTMLEKLNRGEMPYFLTNYLPADSTQWAAPVGQDGIAIITHPDVDVSNLSVDELRAVYQGRITQWNEVGGSESPVIVFSREQGSGTRAGFERLVMGFRQTTPNARIAASSQQIITAVARTPGAIGYVSMGHLDHTIDVLTIDDVQLTTHSVAENIYPLRTTLYVVGLQEPADDYRLFIGWLQSPDGQIIVAQRYAPLIAASAYSTH